jgi:hypothetical protein
MEPTPAAAKGEQRSPRLGHRGFHLCNHQLVQSSEQARQHRFRRLPGERYAMCSVFPNATALPTIPPNAAVALHRTGPQEPMHRDKCKSRCVWHSDSVPIVRQSCAILASSPQNLTFFLDLQQQICTMMERSNQAGWGVYSIWRMFVCRKVSLSRTLCAGSSARSNRKTSSRK